MLLAYRAVRLGLLLVAQHRSACRHGDLVAAPAQQLLHLSEEQMASLLAGRKRAASRLEVVISAQLVVVFGRHVPPGLDLQ